jgi:hypothetical protein
MADQNGRDGVTAAVTLAPTLYGALTYDQQPTKRTLHETDKREDKVWARLNQVDPRKKQTS